MRDQSTYPSRDLSFSISLRNPLPPYSASHHSPRRYSTDRSSGRSGTRSPSASNTRKSDSRGTVQDRYARNRRIQANVPCSSPRGWHDAIRGERRAREVRGWIRSLRVGASRSDPFRICRRASFGNSFADSVSFRFPLRQILEGSPLLRQNAPRFDPCSERVNRIQSSLDARSGRQPGHPF